MRRRSPLYEALATGVARADWPGALRLARAAEGARLGALLDVAPQVPEHLKQLVRGFRRKAAAAALASERLARTVEGALAGAGVRHAFLKGYALAARYWGDPALRPSLDLDVLVPPGGRGAAGRALAAAGFAPDKGHPEVWIGPFGQVDLHDVLVNVSRVPARGAAFPEIPGLFERLERIETRAGALPVLSPPDDLLYLAAHLYFHHGGMGPRWVVDIDLLLRKHPHAVRAAAAVAARTGDPLRALRPLSFALALRRVALGRAAVEGEDEVAARAPLGRIDRAALAAAVAGDATPAARFLLTYAALPARARPAFLRQTLLPSPRVLADVRRPLARRGSTARFLLAHIADVWRGARWAARWMKK